MKILSTFCLAFLVAWCNIKQSCPDLNVIRHDFKKDKTTLYVSTVTSDSIQVKNLNELTPVKKREITIITADHFEISLYELANHSGYTAKKIIIEPTSLKNSRIDYITDWCGSKLTFKTIASFLNFMSVRGYELANQTKKAHRTDYIFRKKQKNVNSLEKTSPLCFINYHSEFVKF